MTNKKLFKSKQSVVYLRVIDGEEYAVKFMCNKLDAMLVREHEYLLKANKISDGVVKVYPTLVKEDNKIGLATKYYKTPPLSKFKSPNRRDVVKFIHKLVLTLIELQKHSIYHGDIKIENIRVTDDGDPVLIDFNSVLTSPKSSKFTGTVDFRAPEIINGLPFDCELAEVYCVGIVMSLLQYKITPDPVMLDLNDPFDQIINAAIANHSMRVRMTELEQLLASY